MFELTHNTKARLLDVVVLSQKNRLPEDNPGAKLVVQIQLTADALVEFDPNLRSFLFTHKNTDEAAQASIEGVPVPEDLTRAGANLGTLKWKQEMTGYRLVIDYGTGGKSNIVLEDSVLTQWRLTPKDGGSVTAKVNIDAPDVSEKDFGRLAKLKSREIEIQLTAPEPAQQSIVPPATPKSSGTASAVIDGSKGHPGMAASQEAAEVAKKAEESGGDGCWAFPDQGTNNTPATGTDGPVVDTKPAASEAPTRPARRSRANLQSVE